MTHYVDRSDLKEIGNASRVRSSLRFYQCQQESVCNLICMLFGTIIK